MTRLLEVESVSRQFGGVQALQDVSLAVEEGSITALIGPNGAGKTTLFNAVTGFVSLDRGSVLMGGVRLDGMPAWRIARQGLARTFQTASGFASLTVWENLMAAGSADRDESVLAALGGPGRWRRNQRKVSDEARRQLARLGLSSLADRRLGDISAASCKLVEIARQLMSAPRLLLLDEPAAGFGPDMLEDLARVLRQLAADGITILIIEHNLPFVMDLASTTYVLAGGRTIYGGPSAAVMTHRDVILHYLGTAHGSARH
jgi:ABC-type branched-subunit amino acid transport system ATPase component